jgi:hypothetical protein
MKFGRLFVVCLVLLVTVSCAVAAYVFLSNKRDEYRSFLEEVYSSGGVKVNLLKTGEYPFPPADRGQPIRVAIDNAVAHADADRIKSIYRFLGSIVGSRVDFRTAGSDYRFDDDIYVYVGGISSTQKYVPRKIADFVEKLKSAIKSIYNNEGDDVLWQRILYSSLEQTNGAVFFFNNEYTDIDYHNIIRMDNAEMDRRPNIVDTNIITRYIDYSVNNPNPEKTVIFISNQNRQKIHSDVFSSFLSYVIIQEIYQGFSLGNDISSQKFKLKTLLYDHDEAIAASRIWGVEAIAAKKENAAQGLCLLDVMYLKNLSELNEENFRWNLFTGGVLTFGRLYLSSYMNYLFGPKELFDPRCW